MSKERQTPCEFYVCEGDCIKGREGTHNKYCQRCDKYKARAKVKHLNLKKQKLEKIKKKEFDME